MRAMVLVGLDHLAGLDHSDHAERRVRRPDRLALRHVTAGINVVFMGAGREGSLA
jgi:hypothetical protein